MIYYYFIYLYIFTVGVYLRLVYHDSEQRKFEFAFMKRILNIPRFNYEAHRFSRIKRKQSQRERERGRQGEVGNGGICIEHKSNADAVNGRRVERVGQPLVEPANGSKLELKCFALVLILRLAAR